MNAEALEETEYGRFEDLQRRLRADQRWQNQKRCREEKGRTLWHSLNRLRKRPRVLAKAGGMTTRSHRFPEEAQNEKLSEKIKMSNGHKTNNLRITYGEITVGSGLPIGHH